MSFRPRPNSAPADVASATDRLSRVLFAGLVHHGTAAVGMDGQDRTGGRANPYRRSPSVPSWGGGPQLPDRNPTVRNARALQVQHQNAMSEAARRIAELEAANAELQEARELNTILLQVLDDAERVEEEARDAMIDAADSETQTEEPDWLRDAGERVAVPTTDGETQTTGDDDEEPAWLQAASSLVNQTAGEVAESRTRLDQLTEQMDRLVKDLDMAMTNLRAIEAELTTTLAALKDADDGTVQFDASLQEVRRQLQDALLEISGATARYEKLKAENERMQRTEMQLRDTIVVLNRSLDTKRVESAKLAAELSNLRKTSKQTQASRMGRIKELNDELRKLKLEMEDGRTERANLVAQLKELEDVKLDLKYSREEAEGRKEQVGDLGDLRDGLLGRSSSEEFDKLQASIYKDFDEATGELFTYAHIALRGWTGPSDAEFVSTNPSVYDDNLPRVPSTDPGVLQFAEGLEMRLAEGGIGLEYARFYLFTDLDNSQIGVSPGTSVNADSFSKFVKEHKVSKYTAALFRIYSAVHFMGTTMDSELADYRKFIKSLPYNSDEVKRMGDNAPTRKNYGLSWATANFLKSLSEVLIIAGSSVELERQRVIWSPFIEMANYFKTATDWKKSGLPGGPSTAEMKILEMRRDNNQREDDARRAKDAEIKKLKAKVVDYAAKLRSIVVQ
jgi:predicted  nucleic acid-binding Zn-ribbon protein